MKSKTDISQIRFKYKTDSLDIKNTSNDPFVQFKKWLNEAIRNKVFEPTAMALSTLNSFKKVFRFFQNI